MSIIENILRLTRSPAFPTIVLGVAAATVGAVVYTLPSKASTNKGRKPPHVFSFVPYLGSAIEMGSGITEFIRKYAKKFQSPIFTATIMGDKCVFLADSEITTIVYAPSFQKNFDDLSLQKQFVANVLTASNDEVKMGFDPNLLNQANSQFHHYISKGEELNRTLAKAQELFLQVMPEICDTALEWKTIPFAETVASAVFKGTMPPFISHDLVSDEAFQRFKLFDSGIIMMFNQAPAFLTKAASEARAALLEQFQSAKFWESASPMMQARRDHLPFSVEAFSKYNLGIFWASVGNTAPAIFWMMVCLLANPEACKDCLEQVQMVDDKKQGKTFSLDDLDEMTLLESAFSEAVRLYSGAFTSRIAKKDFVLQTKEGNFQIEAGSKIMSWWALLHSDPAVFDNPEKFKFDRFVDNKVFTFQSGKRVNLPMGFGGGTHLCPGRKFANYEARMLAAMMMLRFDMKLLDPIPPVNKAVQGIGISQPDSDPRVSIRLRQK